MIRAAALVWLVSVAPVWADPVPEPDGYRMDDYRAPVPTSLAGAVTIGPGEAHALWQDRTAGFIDVMPQAPKPANLPAGTIWRDKPRDSIPGAIWLPNVGYGAIADVTADYFRAGLDKVTGGSKDHPIVVFCLEDCWMSWNAARRAVGWGYTGVHWLPEGTDGWALWDYPLERVTPEPGQPQTGN